MARPGSGRPRHAAGGTPIEDAPWWAQAIFVAVLALIAFPGVVGFLAGWGAWHGQLVQAALAAIGLAVLVLAAVTRRRWQRPTTPSLHDPRPPLVRFSTWLITAFLYPNLLYGILVLTHPDRTITYLQATIVGLLVSTIQTVLGWTSKRRSA